MSPQLNSLPLERRYTVQEIATAWNISERLARRLFSGELISESEIRRVHRRLCEKGWDGPLPMESQA